MKNVFHLICRDQEYLESVVGAACSSGIATSSDPSPRDVDGDKERWAMCIMTKLSRQEIVTWTRSVSRGRVSVV